MRTKVWTISIRIFHWLLAIGFAAAYILSDFHEYENLHYAFGLLVGALVLFRLIYGIIGPRYARFGDFPIAIRHQIEFVTNFFKKGKTYVGHNPAASLVMLGIFFVGLACSISGYLLYSTENPSLVNVALSEDLLEEAHEVLGNLFLVLVIFHLLGLLADRLFHSEAKTLGSIVTGYKAVEAEDTRQNVPLAVFSVVWFAAALMAFVYGNGLATESQGAGQSEEAHQEREHDEEDDH